VAGAACVTVMLQARSRLAWAGRLPAAPMIRRLVRDLTYALPVISFGVPSLTPDLLPCLAGVLVGVLPLLAEASSIRRSMARRHLAMFPVSRLYRCRDAFTFAFGGAAQELLYRWVCLIPLTRLLGAAAAIVVCASLFVIEHLIHAGPARWDVHDLCVQGFLGLALGLLVLESGSLLPALIGNTCYNLPNVIFTLRRPNEGEPVAQDPVGSPT